MFSIFSSETATTAVNIIVILGFLLSVAYLFVWILRKIRPEVVDERFTKKLETSTSKQNIFAFASVVLASTLFDLFNDSNYKMIWIVIIISILTILFHFIYDKVAHTNEAIRHQHEYNTHLTLIEKIMQCKGYNLILNAVAIEKIENRSEEIYIFTENLTTDIPKDAISDLKDDHDNIGLFADLVQVNIPKGKKYTYFLKNNLENIAYIKDYYAYHLSSHNLRAYAKNIAFYLVEPQDFTFFSELYHYKDDLMHDMSFEWLPSLGELGDPDKQFYLELSSSQVQNINEIIVELKSSALRFKHQSIEGTADES